MWITTWQEAEENAAAAMRSWGIRDAKTTGGSTDGGIDITSLTHIAQVKYEAAQVGRPVLQQLHGARGSARDKGMVFFTGAGYSAPAVEFANEHGIALFVYDQQGSMTPANAAAVSLAAPLRAMRHAGTPERRQTKKRADMTQQERHVADGQAAGCCAGCLLPVVLFFGSSVVYSTRVDPESWKGGLVGQAIYTLIALAALLGAAKLFLVWLRSGSARKDRS